MNTSERRHTRDELARLGDEIFDRQIRPSLRPEDDGKFVAIDVDSGEYEMDEDDYKAVMRLLERIPTADSWLVCAGYPTTYRMGLRGWFSEEAPT